VDIAITLGHTDLVGGLLFDKWMTADQQERLLPGFIENPEYHLAYAGGDPDVDGGWSYQKENQGAADIGPGAVKQGDDWIINGTVDNVVNAPIAEQLIVPTSNGGFIVPKDAPGLTIHELVKSTESAARWHHGSVAKVEFESCVIPAANKLEDRMDIRKFAQRNLILRAAINLGVGRGAMDAAIDYAKIRRQGGADIVEHQAIGKFIADMTIKLELARTMIWKAAWVRDNPAAISDYSVSDLPLHIIASTFTAETVHDVTHLAAECFGAMAVMRDMPLQKYTQDSFIFLNSDTNNLATKLRIANAVVRN
jgi:alkylation response protein AidB-like acyl-CoA dehydrogenase